MRRSTLLLGLIAVAGAVAAASLTNRWFRLAGAGHGSEPQAHTRLHIEPDQLNFGKVWETDKFVWPVIIENQGDDPCVVESLSGSCSCQTFNPQQFILDPGEKQRVEITLNLRNGVSHADVEPVREFGVTFWAVSRGQAAASYWSLKGRVRSAFRCPDRVDLGTVSESERTSSSSRFPLVPLMPLSRIEAEIPSPFAHAEIHLPEGGRKRYEVAITPRSGLDKQRYTTTVTLTAVLADGTAVPTVRVPVSFEIGEDIEAVPPALPLGALDIGETARETITLRSRSGGQFVIQSVRAEGDGLTVQPIKHPGMVAYEATQRIDTPGAGVGRVVFVVASPGRREVELVVPVTFAGYPVP
jgi:hypothetical protein